ncbi:hypothetical protein B0H34DRAFT_255931 [Crassisporium funariophilum]|nr:hypothetical protein B0H34DRAFT_255931 [Crassisporium funariophilum]
MSQEMQGQHDCMSGNGQAQNMTMDVSTSATELKLSEVFIAGAKYSTCRRVDTVFRDTVCVRRSSSPEPNIRPRFDFSSRVGRVVWTWPHSTSIGRPLHPGEDSHRYLSGICHIRKVPREMWGRVDMFSYQDSSPCSHQAASECVTMSKSLSMLEKIKMAGRKNGPCILQSSARL